MGAWGFPFLSLFTFIFPGSFPFFSLLFLQCPSYFLFSFSFASFLSESNRIKSDQSAGGERVDAPLSRLFLFFSHTWPSSWALGPLPTGLVLTVGEIAELKE